ncbi:MAG: primosomal protein N', partial [Pseudomonadota bacterium]|nr:primosomal protein N' [Pseudomonadota bacterium]
MTAPISLRVAIDAPQHTELSAPLSYASEYPLPPGTLVRVPLGRRVVTGLVWNSADTAPAALELRSVTEALTALTPLTEPWCRLVDFSAAYYQRSLGEVALSVLPPELRKLGNAQIENRIAKLRKALPLGSVAAAQSARLPVLTDEQAGVVAAIEAPGDHGAAPDSGRGPPVLLHGVTGSGKTEVYLRAAAAVLATGRQALVLVPEINLTPQLEARFAERFAGRTIVSLHSGLTPAQRLRSWLAAHLGLADLVLGTRLAVFASLPRLGLIVVDEEHDPSYKQQEGARYSARDLAVYRGQLEGATVILGSATPSLESWHGANQGRYRRLSLPTRVGGGALPTVRLVDMNRLPKVNGGAPALAPQLVDAMNQRLARGEQSLVFLNRRGYAPVLHCADCGWKSGCPNCSAWRVFHKLDRTLRCHHCGLTERVPRACPECGNLDIAPIGRGTERLEEQLAAVLSGPDGRPPRIARIDADSTRAKGALEARLSEVHAGDVDVLVGTQMVTKGHDFRRVTLVAAVN